VRPSTTMTTTAQPESQDDSPTPSGSSTSPAYRLSLVRGPLCGSSPALSSATAPLQSGHPGDPLQLRRRSRALRHPAPRRPPPPHHRLPREAPLISPACLPDRTRINHALISSTVQSQPHPRLGTRCVRGRDSEGLHEPRAHVCAMRVLSHPLGAAAPNPPLRPVAQVRPDSN
jgi:hypothetical protein